MNSVHLFCIRLFIILGLLCRSGYAATESSTTTTSPVLDTAGTLFGVVELRPTWTPDAGSLDTRNNVEIGYQFNSTQSLSYWQAIDTNLYQAPIGGSSNIALPDAFVKFAWTQLWAQDAWQLDFEPRWHLPISASKRDKNFISELRPQVNLSYRFSAQWTLAMSWIPILHLYSESGFTAGGVSEANPILENRIEVGPKYQLNAQWSFVAPIKFFQRRHASFQPGALYNDSWAFTVQFKPEVFYQLSDLVTTGLAFETANLVQEDSHSFDLGTGFEKGWIQFMLKATL